MMALLVLLPGQAQAHVVNIIGKVSLTGSTLKVTFLDAYNQPMQELDVKASVEELGGKPGRQIALKESEKGVYTGTLPTPPSAKYQVTISFEMAGDKHQALLTAEKGKDQTDVVLPVLGLEDEKKARSNLWLFGGAILVLAAATAYALFRTPPDKDEEEKA
jgi:hypothetical protein